MADKEIEIRTISRCIIALKSKNPKVMEKALQKILEDREALLPKGFIRDCVLDKNDLIATQ